MELKHDCVRDVLIYCEKKISFGNNLCWIPHTLGMICNALPNYTREDVAYTLIQLEEAGFIEAHIMEADQGIYAINVYRLTYSGHEFIDVLKSDTVWEKLKSTIASIGSVSLPILQELGSHYLLAYLTGQ